ncbi:hypothetical protein G4Z05_00645 [Bacillus thermocopriae]|uniref:Lj965 prophage protein n=1 Tax=Neobacillus thermocopriae TaxID=1215031 RepID=A0A6B3TM71_9BACI|nr:hypothetical protein [Neobacillus thermocopriae]NEX77409.1 hypothetical protein [Neobacillus thermocopriae]
MLSQKEADNLIAMLKELKSKQMKIPFPQPTKELRLDLESSMNKKEKFIIDINRKGQFNLLKCTFQTRYRNSIRLLRIDIEGPPHENPDGTIVECPHIHIYKEGYELKWAYPLSEIIQTQNDDLIDILIAFLEYNKVKRNGHLFYMEGGLV